MRYSLPIYQVDTFTQSFFTGNPAAVIPVPHFLDNDLMQNIAAENNLSETAFVEIHGEGKFRIRWFSPTHEIRLCGHATLAAAHVLYRSAEERFTKMSFKTRNAGTISVKPQEDGSYSLLFLADEAKKIRSPKGLRGILGGLKPTGVYQGKDDVLVVVKNKKQLENLQPNFPMLASLSKYRGMIVTAPGDKEYDFVSRCFYPKVGVNEDHVTGSAHTLLTPFWAKTLGKKKLVAKQISPRGGILNCRLRGKKVEINGHAITYLSGQLMLDHQTESIPSEVVV